MNYKEKVIALLKSQELSKEQKEKLENIFPELQESEEERVRKAILELVRQSSEVLEKKNQERMLAWLEKQGEQKPTDKVEPKFKVGDWIVQKDLGIYKIVEVCKSWYEVISYNDGIQYFIGFAKENDCHLWTIADTKDGDVLTFKNDICGIIICKSPTDYDTGSYCRLVNDNFINKEESGWDSTLLVPATKEQCDLLFQEMKKAGYEWDAERKELKKIHNALEECEIENIEHGKYYYCIKDYFCGGRKQASKGDVVQALRGMSIMALGVKANEYFLPVNSIKQKPAWSEKDEKTWKELIEEVKDQLDSVPAPDCRDKEDEKVLKQLTRWLVWLESLKYRVQPKQEWNEEDEEMLKSVIATCELAEQERDSSPAKHLLEMQLNWLKSLKQRIGG